MPARSGMPAEVGLVPHAARFAERERAEQEERGAGCRRDPVRVAAPGVEHAGGVGVRGRRRDLQQPGLQLERAELGELPLLGPGGVRHRATVFEVPKVGVRAASRVEQWWVAQTKE